MAASARFGLANDRVKVCCLTIWLRSNKKVYILIKKLAYKVKKEGFLQVKSKLIINIKSFRMFFIYYFFKKEKHVK